MNATVIPPYACNSRLEHKNKQTSFLLCCFHYFEGTHTLTPTSPEDNVDPSQQQTLVLYSCRGGAASRPSEPPCSSVCLRPLLAEQASGSLEASFLEASWSHSKESISCPFSPLTDTYQSEKCLVKWRFCQWWPESPVPLLSSSKDK